MNHLGTSSAWWYAMIVHLKREPGKDTLTHAPCNCPDRYVTTQVLVKDTGPFLSKIYGVATCGMSGNPMFRVFS